MRTRLSQVLARVVCVVATLALALTTHASNNFRLDLILVARTIGPGGTLTDVGTGTISASPGQQYVIELRYRITDLIADSIGSRGLSSANVRFGTNAGATGSVIRAGLTMFQEDPAVFGPVNTTPVLNPDSSGMGSGGTGLHGVFRGGLTMDLDTANGNSGPPMNTPGLALAQFFIVPLSLSAPGHQSWGTGSSPTPANTNSNTNVWSIYTFVYTVGAAGATFTASAIPDSVGGTRFGYFERSASTNNPVPQSSNAATDASLTINITPVPGACCKTDGECTQELQSSCVSAGRNFLGPNIVCSPNPCPQPGACCFTNASCTRTLSTNCTSQGGVFSGAGTSCTPNLCPTACCFPNLSCLAGSVNDCTIAGGTPAGSAACAPILCCPTPVINAQSISQPFQPPARVELAVSATIPSPATLSYQWRKNNNPITADARITGVNTSTLVLTTSQPGDAATYSCLITASCGRSVTSADIVLTQCVLPSFSNVSPTQNVPFATTANLSVSANALGTVTYQWRKDGANLAANPRFTGITTPNLSIANVNPFDEGFYDCIVTSVPCGTATSPTIRLNVVCAGLASDCNANGFCDQLELRGLRDITAPSPAQDSFFGWTAGIDSARAIVGARFESTPAGAGAGRAYIYTLNGQLATFEATLNASDAAAGNEFGFSTDIDGDWAAVSARAASVSALEQAGAVYVYRRISNVWQFFQKITEPVPTLNAQFGHSIALDADRLLIGSIHSAGAATDSGAAYVYRFNGINWALETAIFAPDGAAADGFGNAVDIDDPYLVISSPYDTDNNTTSGSAYVFFRGINGWVFQSKLRPRLPQVALPIGERVSISGDLLAISAVLEDVNGAVDAGAAYTFRRTDTRWTQQRRLTARVPVANGRFGAGIGFSADSLAVGEFTRPVNGFDIAGSFDVFKRRGNFYFRAASVASPRPESFGRFGLGLATSSGRVISTAYTGTANGLTQAGWARVFSFGALDCNANESPDICEIAQGTVSDTNGNGIPDVCDTALCRGDFNDSGTLTVQDVFDYLADWFSSNLTADFNDSGGVTVQDIFEFIAAWFAPCP